MIPRRDIEAQREIDRTRAPLKRKRRRERRARAKAIDASRPEQRQERQEDPAYLRWLRARCCIAGAIARSPCDGPIDPAHIRFADPTAGRMNPGLGRKPDDRWCLPVCRRHHEAQHLAGNEARWWAQEVGVDPSDVARSMYRDFQGGGDGSAVLRRFAPSDLWCAA